MNSGEDAFVLVGGGERVAASRLVVPQPAISKEEEDRLSIEFVEEIDAETEARLLGKPSYNAGPAVVNTRETLQVQREEIEDAQSNVAGQPARHG